MTDTNRERLAAFDDPEVVTRFLALPERERIAVLKHANPMRVTRGIERALALALFIHAGLRLQTLRTLKLDYFRWAHCRECHIYIAPEAMKAGRPHELVLSSEAAALLELYQRNYRDRLPGAAGPYLLPGKNEGTRSKNAMYEAAKTAFKQAGLKAHPHLVRHIIAKICRERDPTSAFAVSRVLGHASLNTTNAHYLGTESKAAGRFVDRLLEIMSRGVV